MLLQRQEMPAAKKEDSFGVRFGIAQVSIPRMPWETVFSWP